MIRFDTQRTKLPTRSAAGRRGPANTTAFLASVAVAAQILSACSNPSPATGTAARSPDLTDQPPKSGLRADQVAQIKAELIQARDDQERAAAQQQTLQ